MPGTENIDRLIATATAVRDSSIADEYALAMALGVFVDDPESPQVSAVVYEGKLFNLAIADGLVNAVRDGEMSWQDVATIVLATINNAFFAWDADRERLVKAVQDKLAASGDRTGLVDELRHEIDAREV